MPPSPSLRKCNFDRVGDTAICRTCGRKVPNAPLGRLVAQCKPKSRGPGTQLKALLAMLGIHATPTCKCNKMARQMDEWGADECLNHVEEIVDVMEETAKKRKLPFLRVAARVLVRRAISQSRAMNK